MLENAIGVRLLESSEVRRDDMLIYKALQINLSALPLLDCAANVAGYGTMLKDALSVHDAIKEELNQFFGLDPPNQARLHLLFGVPLAETYRWEALCATNRFLALNGCCSVSRIPISGGAKNIALRTFSEPMKLVAFLSAVGISAVSEFEAITTILPVARANGLDIKAVLYVCEEELLSRSLPNVEIRPIPDTGLGIEAALKADRPQLLHFFCHGRFSDLGEPLLELASISDQDIEAPIGSIALTIQRLGEVLVAIGSVWLTVLNSCSGAKQIPRLHSMAATLVVNGGSPISIGMAEEIADIDATLFTGAFYKEALEALREATSSLQSGDGVVIDLGPPVGRARKELYSKYEQDLNKFGRWCLPVLYHHQEQLRVARLANPEMRDRIEAVATALRNMAATTPLALRIQIRNILGNDPAIPKGLWPDQYGNPP
jgi:hypothetical protein